MANHHFWQACHKFLKYKLTRVEGSCVTDGNCNEVADDKATKNWVTLDLPNIWKIKLNLASIENYELTELKLQLEAYFHEDRIAVNNSNYEFTVNLYPDCKDAIVQEGTMINRTFTKGQYESTEWAGKNLKRRIPNLVDRAMCYTSYENAFVVTSWQKIEPKSYDDCSEEREQLTPVEIC